MAETDSSDHLFSALEILSAAAVAAAAVAAAAAADCDCDRDNHEAPPYADDSILICSLPETPCSSSSPSSRMGQTLDPPSCNGSRPPPARKKKSALLRKGSGCAKIRSSDSDEEKRDDALGKECLVDENGNPSFAPDIPCGASDLMGGDGSNESMVPSELQRFGFLDVMKMMSKKPNGRFEDTDILEIAAMKGIDFPPPRWWKPGGYGAEKPQGMEMK